MSIKGFRVLPGALVIGFCVLIVVGVTSRKPDADDVLYPRKDYSQDVSKIYHDLGCWQVKRKNYKRAIKTFLDALQEDPDSLELYDQLGKAYEGDADKNRAMKTYFKAMARNQRFGEVRFGGYREEVSDQSDLDTGGLLLGSREEWNGQPLTDKSLLVYTPEADSDTIMLLRFIPELARKVGRVVLVVKPSLMRLCSGLKHAAPNIEIIDTTSKSMRLPLCQSHIALTKVPFCLHASYENIPGARGYLKLDDYTLQKFENSLFAQRSSLAIGLALDIEGSLYADVKSLNMELFDQLSKLSGVTFYLLPTIGPRKEGGNLKQIAADLVERLKKVGTCIDVAGLCHDWADVAAVIAGCDLIMGLDNAIMHLAGAMGKKAVILLPEAADWRWMCYSEFDMSVWYRSLIKLYKGPALAWGDLIGRAVHVAMTEHKKQSVKL